LAAKPKRLLAQREAELLEAHRLEVQERDPADRCRDLGIAQREVEQRPDGDHRQLLELLRAPAQLREHLGRRLDLVQEEQCRPVDHDPPTERDLEPLQRGPRIVVGEAARELRPALEVRLDHRAKASLAPRARQEGLSDLPGSPQDQGLPARAPSPCNQVALAGSQHAKAPEEPAKKSTWMS
jgi:hypothetical protein